MSVKFYELLKEKRLALELSLRKFCQLASEDPANYSRIERGLRPAPSDDVVYRYAAVLKLQGDELRDFRDLASLSRREIPRDISDEELYAKLPAFLRSIDRDKPSEEQLEAAIRVTKKAFRP
jgi:transcriptional regulator with XRE-family HTH domain